MILIFRFRDGFSHQILCRFVAVVFNSTLLERTRDRVDDLIRRWLARRISTRVFEGDADAPDLGLRNHRFRQRAFHFK
jgi:hypothetical protein